jgi:pimeloyl-ACP methyl ester carboxylesterase
MTSWKIGVLAACILAAPSVGVAQQTAARLRSAPARLTEARSAEAAESFDSNGVQISYIDRGRGAPVVLLHGLTGSAARHWEGPGVIAALETAGYRAIAMDCRGHGQSGKPHDVNQYGLEMVRDVIRLLDHLRIDRAHLVGYSMGGVIASQLLIRYPDRLRTLTLLGAGWQGEDMTAITAQMNALADGFAKRDASWLVGAVTGGQNTMSKEEIAAMNAALFARNDHEALAAATRGLIPLYDVSRDRLHATKVPVLGLIGDQDTFNLEPVKRMATVVPKMEVVELPGATHATSVRPAVQPLIAFLNKHTQN